MRVPALISDSDRLNVETVDRRPAFISLLLRFFFFFFASTLAHSAAALHSLPRLLRRADGAFIVDAHARPRVRARDNTRLAVFLRRSCVVFITPLRLCFHAASPNHLSSLCAALVVRQRLGGGGDKNKKSEALQQLLSQWPTTNIFVELKWSKKKWINWDMEYGLLWIIEY